MNNPTHMNNRKNTKENSNKCMIKSNKESI